MQPADTHCQYEMVGPEVTTLFVTSLQCFCIRLGHRVSRLEAETLGHMKSLNLVNEIPARQGLPISLKDIVCSLQSLWKHYIGNYLLRTYHQNTRS